MACIISGMEVFENPYDVPLSSDEILLNSGHGRALDPKNSLDLPEIRITAHNKEKFLKYKKVSLESLQNLAERSPESLPQVVTVLLDEFGNQVTAVLANLQLAEEFKESDRARSESYYGEATAALSYTNGLAEFLKQFLRYLESKRYTLPDQQQLGDRLMMISDSFAQAVSRHEQLKQLAVA